MDISVKCPECGTEFQASDMAETAPCNSCGAIVNTKDNKKSRFKIKEKEKKPAPVSEPATNDVTPAGVSEPADVIRKIQNTRTMGKSIMNHDPAPPGGKRDAQDSDFTSEDLKSMDARKRRKIIAGRIFAIIAGVIVPVAGINGLIYYADYYNETAKEWVLISSIVLAGFWAVGLCISTMMSSFREFFIAACFPIVGIAGVMVKPLIGLGMFALSLLYSFYFVIMQTKSFFYKGYFFGVLGALFAVMFQNPKMSLLIDYFRPALEQLDQLLSR